MNVYELALVVHLLGVALGLGAATVADVLFVKSLKDEKITDTEKGLLDGASLVIWIGIGIMLLSGGVMFWLNWNVLSQQARMLAHVSIAAVIIANGLYLNFSVAPKLAHWSQEKEGDKKFVPEYRKIRKLGFVSGAVSFTSWWMTLALGFGRRFLFPPLSYAELMGMYVLLVIVAVLLTFAVENVSWKRHTKLLSHSVADDQG